MAKKEPTSLLEKSKSKISDSKFGEANPVI